MYSISCTYGESDMNSLPPLYSLRAFEMAARYGSFTKAAECLNLSQSAISQHVKNLESFYGNLLFIRNKNKIHLTEFGKSIYNSSSTAFNILEEMNKTVFDSSPILRVKTPTSLTNRWLLESMNRYAKEFSDQRVSLSSHWMETDTVDFSRESYDAAILLSDQKFSPNYSYTLLFPEWLVPVCSFGHENFQSLEALLESTPLIHSSLDKSDWKLWAGRAFNNNLNLDSGMTFDTIDQGMSAAQHGLGVCIGDLVMISNDLRNHKASVPIKIAVYSGKNYYFVYPKNTVMRESINNFLSFLIENTPIIKKDLYIFLR